jgi:hypothetical protein
MSIMTRLPFVIFLLCVVHVPVRNAASQEPAKPTAKKPETASGADASKPKATGGAVGTEIDAVHIRLSKAKEAYQLETTKAKELLLKDLDKQEVRAQSNGNKELLDKVRAQRDKFNTTGDLPDVVDVKNFRRNMREAIASLENAMRGAQGSYVKEKKDFEANSISQEIAELKKTALKFARREIWRGDSIYKNGRTPIKLEIFYGEPPSFTGTTTVFNIDGTVRHIQNIEGKSEKGYFSYQSGAVIQSGNWQPTSSRGQIRANRIDGEWQIKNGGGKGTFVLHLESSD